MTFERLTTLDAVAAEVWRQLARAPHDKHHAWRTPVLATVISTVDGDAADARTVVLREVHAEAKQLVVFTDRRAAKVAQAMSRPTGTLAMWSKTLGWQLRCRVRLGVVADDAANAVRWARLANSAAAADYLSPRAPGAALGDAPAASGPHHFAAITAQVLRMDWLELHRDGHRRAVFDGDGARWVQP